MSAGQPVRPDVLWRTRAAGLPEMMRVSEAERQKTGRRQVCDSLDHSPELCRGCQGKCWSGFFGSGVANAFEGTPLCSGDAKLAALALRRAGVEHARRETALRDGSFRLDRVADIETERACIWTPGGLLSEDPVRATSQGSSPRR